MIAGLGWRRPWRLVGILVHSRSFYLRTNLRSYNQAMRYRLRTLLIVLAIGPPLIAVVWANYMSFAVLAFMCAAFVVQSAVIYGVVTFTLHAMRPMFDAMANQDDESAAPRDRPT